jgi:hypothetical protein
MMFKELKGKKRSSSPAQQFCKNKTKKKTYRKRERERPKSNEILF